MRSPVQVVESKYAESLGASSLIRRRISDLLITTDGQKTVNQKRIRSLPILLPPIEEQKRIVAIVDELMAMIVKIVVVFSYAASSLITSLDVSSLSGLSHTPFTGDQSLVSPLQRSGCRSFAAA